MSRLRLALVLLAITACPALYAADAPEFAEGREYVKVPTPTVAVDSKKVSIEEFFWYGCPHCYRLDPQLDTWLKKQPADVVFTRIPDNLGRDVGKVHQRAFYVAKTLGIEDKIHRPLMDALVSQQLPLVTLPLIRDYFVQIANINPDVFDSTAQSFVIDADLAKADQLAINYQVTSVPTIVVGGEYLTDNSQPGIYDARLSEAELYTQMLKVVDFLVEKVRKERKSAH